MLIDSKIYGNLPTFPSSRLVKEVDRHAPIKDIIFKVDSKVLLD